MSIHQRTSTLFKIAGSFLLAPLLSGCLLFDFTSFIRNQPASKKGGTSTAPSTSPGDSTKQITFSGSQSVAEGSPFTIVATLSKSTDTSVSFDYKTENLESLSFHQRAEAVQDYQQSYGRITFAPGETSKTISIATVTSSMAESTEKFKLILDNAQGATLASSELELNISDSNSAIFGADTNSVIANVGRSTQRSIYFPVALNTLYVDAAIGSDANSGLSESSPLATIQQAANLASAGTEIIIKNGIYREQVTIPSSGTADHPIVFKAKSGHNPVVAGSNTLGTPVLVNDPPQENVDFFTTGFEQSTIDSALTTSSPTGDGATGVTIDTQSANAAHGNQSATFVFTSPSASNKGTVLYRSFGSTRAAGKSVLYFRTYFALSSDFTLNLATRMDIARLEGLNASDVSTNFLRLLIRKDGSNNRYYFDLLNSAGTSMGDSRSSSLYVTPGGGYVYFEMGFDSNNSTTPLTFAINGTPLTLGSQSSLASCVVNTVRFGVIHNSSASVGYPNAGNKVAYDSIRISSLPVGEFTSVWPPNTLHSNNFESSLGSFTKDEGSGNVITLSTAQKKFGSQSALMSFNGTSGVSALKHSFSAKEDIFVRFFVYLDSFDLSNTTSSSNNYRWNILTLSEDSTARVYLSLLKTTTGLKLDARVATPDVTIISNYYKGYPGEIKNGQWYQIELRYRGNDTVKGGSELWLNAVSIGGNYDRTATPDVYYGLDTSGLRINNLSLGAATGDSSTTLPIAGSKLYLDDYRISSGAPAGLIPNSESIRMYQASYDQNLYAGADYSKPGVFIQSDSVNTEGQALKRLENRSTLSAGSFVGSDGIIYFRPLDDAAYTNQSFEFGVRDVNFDLNNKSYIAIQGLQLRGANHGNRGAVYIHNGGSNNWVINNLIQGNAAAGVRVEGTLSNDGLSIVKMASDNHIMGNHFRENLLTFGSGIRIDEGQNMVIEHNWFESDVGANITGICILPDQCKNLKIRRNKFTSAGESNIYLSKYLAESQIYENIFHGARSSAYATMKNGVRSSSGGSGIHLARDNKSHLVFNNLIYDVDGTGVLLRAKVRFTKVFNNTIMQVAGKGVGTGIDLAKDADETYLTDTDNNGILDGQEDVEQNVVFNNLLGMIPGSNRCIDIEGYDADNANTPVYPDQTNKSDYNAFYQCGRVAMFASVGYTEGTFSQLASTALGLTGLAREEHSSIISSGTTLFQDANNQNFQMSTPALGGCLLTTTCPWSP